MTIKLSWDDLLIQDIAPLEFEQWIAEWSFLVSGQIAPVFMSKVGNWFLRRPDNTTQKLDVLAGTLTTISRSDEEFGSLVNNPAWQEEHLHSGFVYRMHELGKIPGAGQCYALAPHPATGATPSPERTMMLDIRVWQSICSQMFSKAAHDASA